VTVRVGDGAEIYRRLLRRGVIVRPVAAYGLPEHLRVTIGTDTENVRFLDALEGSIYER
jgi:histidinol-phosphate aminotransferase